MKPFQTWLSNFFFFLMLFFYLVLEMMSLNKMLYPKLKFYFKTVFGSVKQAYIYNNKSLQAYIIKFSILILFFKIIIAKTIAFTF